MVGSRLMLVIRVSRCQGLMFCRNIIINLIDGMGGWLMCGRRNLLVVVFMWIWIFICCGVIFLWVMLDRRRKFFLMVVIVFCFVFSCCLRVEVGSMRVGYYRNWNRARNLKEMWFLVVDLVLLHGFNRQVFWLIVLLCNCR